MITTERALPDIVGRWLERDNKLLIPLLSALLKSADSRPDRNNSDQAGTGAYRNDDRWHISQPSASRLQ